jgi:hypothetical protein
MKFRCLGMFLAASCLLPGAKNPTPTGMAGNSLVRVSATVYADKASIQQKLGSDLGGYYVVVEVKLSPTEKLKIDRDDFQLRTDRDGEKAKPFTASQIAGKSALVVSQTYDGGGIAGEDSGPVLGGGYPGGIGRMPGSGGGIGNSGGTASNEARVDNGAKSKPNPLLATLNEKILPEKEVTEPITGLLYFPMESKQKPKDLELTYTTPHGKLTLRFK